MTPAERAAQVALAETIYLKHVVMGIVAKNAAQTGEPDAALKQLSETFSAGLADDLGRDPEALAIAQDRLDLFVAGALKLARAYKPPKGR